MKRKKNILLVDDDPFLQCLYRKTLEREGFNLQTVNDGMAALEKLPELHPDLMVLDLMLPKLDGMKVLEAIRANSQHKDLPVLILSNAYLPQVAQEAMKAGANAGILKSECSPRRLVKIIRDTLQSAEPVPTDNKPHAGRSSWISGLLGGKGGNHSEPENSSAKEFETDASEPAASPEFLDELMKSWPTEISMIRGFCLKYAKAGGGQEAENNLREIYRRLRLLGARAAMAEWFRISQLSNAVEAMLYEHGVSAEKCMSQSVVQTMFQGVDGLEHLFKAGRPAPAESLKKTRILLVDDDPVCNKANELAFKRVDFETVCAGDGTAALALLENGGFDLILLDVNMPGLNGFETCKKLRLLPRCKEIPVIFVTIEDDFQTRAQSVLCGGNGMIAKPISPLELIVRALIFLLRSQSGKPSTAPPAGNAPAMDKNSASGKIPGPPPSQPKVDKELRAAQTAMEDKVKALTQALAEEKKQREEAEQRAAEQAELQRKLEDAHAENQKARERLEEMMGGPQPQTGDGVASPALKLDGRARALQSVCDFVEHKTQTLTKELAAQTERTKSAAEQAAECARRMGELEAALASTKQAKETLLRRIEVAGDGTPRADLENALAETQKEETTLLRKIEATWQEFEAQQQAAVSEMEVQTKEVEENRAAAEQTQEPAEKPAVEAKQNEEAEQQAAEISQQPSAPEAELAASKQTQEQLRAQLAEQQKLLDERVQAHHAELGTLAERTKELETTQAVAEEKVTALIEALAAETKRSKSAEEQAAEISHQRSALEAELTTSKEAQTRLRAQLAEHQQQLEAQVQTHNVELDNLKQLEASRTAAEEKVKELTQKLAAETKRSESAEQQATGVSQQRSTLEAELTANKQAQEQLRAQLAEQQKQLDAQVQTHNVELGNLKQLEASRAALETQVAELTQKLAAEAGRSKSAEQQAAGISQQRSTLEVELAASKQAREQLLAQLAEQQKLLDAHIQKYSIELGNLAGRTKELDASRAALEAQVAQLTQKLAAETKRSESAEQQAAGVSQQRSALETELATSRQAQEQLRAQLAEQQKQLEAQTQAHNVELGNLKQLEAGRAAMEAQIAELTHKLASVTERYEKAEQQAAGVSQQRSALEAELAASKQAQEQLRAQLAEQQQLLDAHVQKHTLELGNLAGRTKELEAGRAEMQEKINALTQALEAAEEKVEELTHRLAAEVERCEKAEQQAADANQQRSALEAELAAGNQAQAQLRAQLAEQQQLVNLTSAELEGFRRCAGAETQRLEHQVAEAEKTRAELSQQLDAARALACTREDAISALNIELQKHRDTHERLDLSLQNEVAQRRDIETRVQAIQSQLDDASRQLTQKCAAEQGWLERESELQGRLHSQQDELTKIRTALASQELELKNTHTKVEESQILQTVLCAKIQALTEQGESAIKIVQDLEAKAARAADAGRQLAGLRYAVLDASRLSANLHLKRFQMERQNLDAMRQLLSSLAQTPLSMAQRGMVAEVQNSMDGFDNARTVATQVASNPVEMPNFRSSEFRLAEVIESAFDSIRVAAKAAGVAVNASVADSTSGRVIGYAEHIHQLITLLAASPLTIVEGVKACDPRVEIKAGNAKAADMALRITFSTGNPQDLLSHLSAVTASALAPQTASFTEAEFGLSAGWQLALAMGAQPALEVAGANEVCLTLSLPVEMVETGSPAPTDHAPENKAPANTAAPNANVNGKAGSHHGRKAKGNAHPLKEACAATE